MTELFRGVTRSLQESFRTLILNIPRPRTSKILTYGISTTVFPRNQTVVPQLDQRC